MYYVLIQDAVCGPYSIDELGQMLAARRIAPITMAVMEGRENWMALEKLIDIAIAYPSPVTPNASAGELHVSKKVKQGKQCPFCGGKKVQSAAKEFFTTGFVRIFSPKVCKRCDAIWTPKVEMSTAFLIFSIGIIGIIAAMVITGPQISYLAGMRDTRPDSIGPSPLINWLLGGIILVVSLTAARKSFRYLGSAKVRSFRVLRHPHRALHG